MGDCKIRFYDKGSELWFGDFIETDYFRIEKSEYYDRFMKHECIKAADCVVCQYNDDDIQILFIEGKKNLHSQRKGFRGDISDIAMQFMDSLYLICGSWLRSIEKKIMLPSGFSQYFQQCGQILFVLVIKNCPKDELAYIEEALEYRLKRENLIWNINIRAYNEEIAIRKNIVLAEGCVSCN